MNTIDQIPLLQAVGEVSLVYTKNNVILPNNPITSATAAHQAFKQIFNTESINHREFMFALYLNRANRIQGYAQISAGGINGTVCDPKVVFQCALKLNASGIILAHNHPSGNLKPSRADIHISEKLQDAGRLLDIQLIDHLIVTD